jgi:hypothetical protein
MAGLGSILSVVAGVVLVATGYGVVAGAALIAGGLASAGVIGGSIGSFLNSGMGKGLLAAVSLGSMAVAAYGSSALDAGMEASNSASTAATVDANTAGGVAQDTANISSQADANIAASAANGGNASLSNALNTGADSDAVTTTTDYTTGTQVSQDIGRIANMNQSLSDANGVTNLNGPNGINGAPPEQGGLGANAMQASQAQTGSDTSAVASSGAARPGLVGSTASPGAPAGTDTGAGAGAAPAAGGAPVDQSPNGVSMADMQPGAGQLPQGVQPATASPQDMVSDTQPSESVNAPSGGVSGMLGRAASGATGVGGVGSISPMSAGIQAGGQILAGVGSGIAQNEAIEKQIQAQEFGQLSYQNQSEVAQLQAAAAKPITVPSGYLQRAQAVKNMVGASPAPTPGQPISPFTAAPVPPGMQSPTTQNPTGGMI